MGLVKVNIGLTEVSGKGPWPKEGDSTKCQELVHICREGGPRSLLPITHPVGSTTAQAGKGETHQGPPSWLPGNSTWWLGLAEQLVLSCVARCRAQVPLVGGRGAQGTYDTRLFTNGRLGQG